MKLYQLPCRFLIANLLLCLLHMPLALSHDPGLSFVKLSLTPHQSSAEIVYALRDIDSIVDLDTNFDGSVNDVEWQQAQPRLAKLAVELLTWGNAENNSQISHYTITRDSSDAIQFNLSYPAQAGRPLIIESSLLNQLPRGHRQYITVFDQHETLLAESVLSSDRPELRIDSPLHESTSIFSEYFVQGVIHIRSGFDHLLFLITLLLPSVLMYRKILATSTSHLKHAIYDIIKVVTAFTLAHTISLVLGVWKVITLPVALVEIAIAISVVLAACNNIKPVLPGSRWQMAFAFGLVHGLGFAGALANTQLPVEVLTIALVGFNFGVEAGQLIMVSLLFPVLFILRRTIFYEKFILKLGSATIALIGFIWVIQRAI